MPPKPRRIGLPIPGKDIRIENFYKKSQSDNTKRKIFKGHTFTKQ